MIAASASCSSARTLSGFEAGKLSLCSQPSLVVAVELLVCAKHSLLVQTNSTSFSLSKSSITSIVSEVVTGIPSLRSEGAASSANQTDVMFLSRIQARKL